MATIQLDKFEMAEMFGLRYSGDTWNGTYDVYSFQIGDTTFLLSTEDMWIENSEHAKQLAGEKVLLAIGKLVKL